jgi:DNA mismatch repair protein MutS
LAIARAVIEYVHNAPRLGCRTLFATHFHELTALADLLPGVCCARMDVLEDGERIVFLHRVVPGAADRSYGIHVAEVAGIPRALTRRAQEVLAELERGPGPGPEAARAHQRSLSRADDRSSIQMTFFAPPSPVLTTLRELDVEALSPLEALTKLYELRNLAQNETTPTP